MLGAGLPARQRIGHDAAPFEQRLEGRGSAAFIALEAYPPVRHVVPILLALVMLLPAAVPAAAVEVHCQTGNGPRTLDQIGQELYAVGFNGPWQVDAIMQAYARTTGDAVSCDNGLAFGVPAPAAPAAPHAPGTLVLFIGGLDSTPSGNDLNFGLLADELVANWATSAASSSSGFTGPTDRTPPR